jgi:hypothetical protein
MNCAIRGPFWKHVVEDEAFRLNVQVEFIGNVNSRFQQRVLNDEVLQGFTAFVPHVPHREVLKRYNTTDVQLLVLAHTSIAPGNLPGKFFEYLASGKPVLAIGPTEGDAAHVLKQTGAGVIREQVDSAGIKRQVSHFYDQWKRGAPFMTANISAYSRKYLTEQLIRILTEN